HNGKTMKRQKSVSQTILQSLSPRNSLRARLLIWFMSALIFLSALMLLDLRGSARTAANEAYDRVLYGSALAILDRVLVIDGEIEVDIPYVSLEMLTSTAQDRVFYQVMRQDGHFLTGYRDLPEPLNRNIPGTDQPQFYDAEYNGETIRVARISRYIASPKNATRVIVKVAETTQARSILIEEMLTNAIIRQVILIIVAGLILWTGVSWGLRPLARLREALKRRNPKDLHPITHKVPNEVQHLVDGINDLMARLAENITSMRRFTSNAAHQLRTPIAAIQTQTELALKSTSQDDMHYRLEHLKHSTAQSTRLIHQLLSLAQATPNDNALKFEALNIAALCQKVTGELVPDAIRKGIDLGLENNLDGECINGNDALLAEAIRNLIHNAITYSPKESMVTVALTRRQLKDQDSKIEICVKDNGPGIDLQYHPTLFERFDRAGRSDGEGCGLGLPIVKEIVASHFGQVVLESSPGKGTAIFIYLPMLTDQASKQ
ncbi:MAG: sensor histidine kinase N-terminal domain-containing protein, partial [Alphaproteobacteria bacterium]|nr:sensor histidine kinase N-terminal domain-containing protein [Alphaproteobacteria bacterium]